jgi:hypothetical protein
MDVSRRAYEETPPMQAEQRDHGDWNLPAGLPALAQRTLAAAGYTRLEQLTNVSETDLQQLHGVGPKALEQLRRALAACGLSFARRG